MCIRDSNEVVLPGEGVGDVLQHNEIIAAIEHVKADIELICLPVKPLSSRRILHHVNVDAALGTEQPEHVGHIVEKRMAVADKQNFHLSLIHIFISFLTAGEPEVRAWTITQGTRAPQAAGKIHSDIERGFIRAEVISFEELMACGSLAAAREKGLVRSEGKDYVMQDGDVVLFRFNV